MRIPRINASDATGLFDKMAGLSKEILGVVVDEDRLISAGEAQQEKGSEKLRDQAKADAHRAKAKAADTKERAAQSAKAS